MRRFRLFAGPNGSGKSTLYAHLRKTRRIHTEIYVSADRIEAELRRRGKFTFNAYRIRVSQEEFRARIETSTLLPRAIKQDYRRCLEIRSGQLIVPKSKANSYLASIIADYLANKLFESEQSFCFETVMSHKSKITLLKNAVKHQYRTYLYFVFTTDPKLNQLRVAQRVQEGGHGVPSDKIHERYYRSMKLLPSALHHAKRAYLVDNSNKFDTVAIKDRGRLKWLVAQKSTMLAKYLAGHK